MSEHLEYLYHLYSVPILAAVWGVSMLYFRRGKLKEMTIEQGFQGLGAIAGVAGGGVIFFMGWKVAVNPGDPLASGFLVLFGLFLSSFSGIYLWESVFPPEEPKAGPQ